MRAYNWQRYLWNIISAKAVDKETGHSTIDVLIRSRWSFTRKGCKYPTFTHARKAGVAWSINACICSCHLCLHACNRPLFARGLSIDCCAYVISQHVRWSIRTPPPVPIRTPEWPSRLSGQRRILYFVLTIKRHIQYASEFSIDHIHSRGQMFHRDLAS